MVLSLSLQLHLHVTAWLYACNPLGNTPAQQTVAVAPAFTSSVVPTCRKAQDTLSLTICFPKHTSTTGTQHTTTDNKHSATRPCFFQAWTQLYVYVCVCRPNSMGLPKIMAATTHPHCCVFGQCVHLCSTLTQCSAISCSLSGLMGVCAGAATADT